ncbi:MAG: carbon-nitrogen hydrolase family protein [Proteobacteria bacterium]|nr:carbon-nitrogen hydrolase family protein [Pseudomonadota bacterium]
MKSKRKFMAAAVQCFPVFLNISKTIDKIESIVKEAAKKGAELIGFPEAIIPTYPYWVWLESPLTWREKYTKKFFENSLEIDGPHTKRLCQIAKGNRSYLVIGINERVRGTIYNSQVFISEKGAVDGIHRKLVPTFAERSVWGRGDGSTLNTYKTRFGIVGGLICAEHNMPLARYALLSQYEEIHVASYPGFPIKGAVLPYQADIAVRNHAIEGQVFVINSTSTISKEMINQLFDTDDKRSLLEKVGGGFSSIINPLGFYIAGPLKDKEGIIYAEIDTSEILSAKRTIDAIGHYSRPDVLSLRLNKSHQENLDVE